MVLYWHKIESTHWYTGWLVTGGTSGKGMILREKRSRKYRIKIFRLRICFRENRLWIFARCACTLSRLVIMDLTVDRCLDWRYVDKHFQCDRSVFLPINLLSDFYRYPLSVPISLPSYLHTAKNSKIQSRFSRKQIFKRQIFILYFRLLFSRRITSFPLVPPVSKHPVYTIWMNKY